MPLYHLVHTQMFMHTPTQRTRGTMTFSQTPESSMMAYLRENEHFSCVFERQVRAFRSQTWSNINHLCLLFSYSQMAKALAYWRWPWWWLFQIQPLNPLPNSNAMFSQGPFFLTPDKAHMPVQSFHFLTPHFDFKVIRNMRHQTIWIISYHCIIHIQLPC